MSGTGSGTTAPSLSPDEREGKKDEKKRREESGEKRRSHFLTLWMKASVCKEAALFQ